MATTQPRTIRRSATGSQIEKGTGSEACYFDLENPVIGVKAGIEFVKWLDAQKRNVRIEE
jgi:hypothetical protein